MLAEDADLPFLAHDDPDFASERFHDVVEDLARRTWLVRSDLGYLVLGREQGMALLKDRRLSFPAVELLELQGLTDGIIHERTVKGLMTQSGPPHARLRRLVTGAFTPRQVERLRPRLREYLEGLWQDIAPAGRCDAVTALARPLPSMAIAELLGVPGDAALLARWSASLQAVFDMDMDARRAEIEAAYEEVRNYTADLVARRREQPGDDLMSALVHYERDGDRLTDDEIYTLAASIISGGTDTTESQLAHGLRLFADHPEQWDLLGNDPALAERACQEVLRFEPIVPFTARLVREELEVEGIVFPAGTVLFVCAATANRDPQTYTDPGRFDITADRGGAQVVTFGFGAHFCAGSHLARAEIIEALTFLAPRMRDLRPDGEPSFGTPAGIYSMHRLPLRFTARPA
ncbi:MAG TPA: cytochrome P450 [Streptosporangiaceae bacterium]|nr:cytochrome P450 [Streptosporangiaceae bacterium]